MCMAVWCICKEMTATIFQSYSSADGCSLTGLESFSSDFGIASGAGVGAGAGYRQK